MTTPKVEIPGAGWSLWFRWLGVHIIGAVVIIVLAPVYSFLVQGFVLTGGYEILRLLSGAQTFEYGVPGALSMLLVLTYGGQVMGIIGSLQWMVLREQRPTLHAKGWIVRSILSGIFGGISLIPMVWLGPISEEIVANAPVLIFTLLVASFLIIGIMQWLALRRQFSHSGWWLLACTASGLIGGAFFIFRLIPIEWAVIIAGALYPIATGIVLVRLLKRVATSSS